MGVRGRETNHGVSDLAMHYFFHGVLIYVGMIKIFELESHDMELESTFYTTPNQAFHT
jgi:hypothetical protein